MPYPGTSALENVLSNSQGVTDLFGTMRQDQEQNQEPLKLKSEIDPATGEQVYSAENISGPAMAQIMKALEIYPKVIAGMQQHADLLAQQEAKARANPLMNVLSTVAGNLAVTDPRLPPLVSALGRSSLQLNPTADELARRRIGLESEIAKTATEGAGLGLGLVREHRMEDQMLMEMGHKRELEIARRYGELSDAAQKGELTDATASAKSLRDIGMPGDKAIAEATTLVGISNEKRRLLQEAETAKDERQRRALEAQATGLDKRLAVMMAGLKVKTDKQQLEEDAVEQAAQNIAKMDKSSLNAMRDISSFRDIMRTRIFNRAKEINPQFNTAEVKRKMDMEQSFTVGKDGQGIQSFDTFLQHAGEVQKTIAGLYQSKSPALNKPMNWWRKNMAGSPEYQRFLVSLEPVGKEFESFLLNQRALYVDDRKQIQTLLDGNSSPRQIDAALKQMAKTAKDRYSAMNQRYKRTMGEDIEAPFSPEAQVASENLGIKLATPKAERPPLGTFEK